LDLKALLLYINGKIEDMPTHTIKKIYKKPYIGPTLPLKKTKTQSLSSPYLTKNEPQMIHHTNDTHVIVYFPPDSMIYTEPTIPLELNKKPHIETLTIRILCIHHKSTTIDIPNLEAKIRQITTKLQINPSYITTPPPTPNNTKVHKHPKWSKSPYLPQLNPSNAPQLPDFPHIYQAKFLPQYCYYTDGSFIPLKQQANGMWDRVQAGYGIWNPLLKINLPQRLIGLQNILRAEMSAIHHTL
jgi:hypothetical protein